MKRMWQGIILSAVLLATVGDIRGSSLVERDFWYAVKFSGTPVGIGNESWVLDKNGWRHESHLEITVSRETAKVRMILSSVERDGVDGRLQEFQSSVNMNGTRMETSGLVIGDSLFIESSGNGFTRREVMVWEEDAVGQAAMDSLVRRRLAAGDKTFTQRVFDPATIAFRTYRFETIEATAGESDENEQWKVVKIFEDGVPILTSYLDEHFDAKRMVLQQMGIEIVIEQMARDEIGSLELDPNFDMMRESEIRCAGFPGGRESLEEVTYRLSFLKPVGDLIEFEGPNQTAKSRSDREVDIVVTRRPRPHHPKSDNDPQAFLESDRYIQADHPAIRDVADSLVAGSGLDGIALARHMGEWVNAYIENKHLGQGFATAVDVLGSRGGDCTEHAVLLAATLRAAGIPARVVVGLAYADGTLVGHMWTEAYDDGWWTVDALDVATSPIRIRISAAGDARAYDETSLVKAYSLVGGMTAEVTNYKRLQ